MFLVGYLNFISVWFPFGGFRFRAAFEFGRNLAFDCHELIQGGLEPVAICFVRGIGGHLFAVALLVRGHGDVVKLAVLIEAEAAFADEVAAAVVDEHLFAVVALLSEQDVREIHAVELSRQWYARHRSDRGQHIGEAKELFADARFDRPRPPRE